MASGQAKPVPFFLSSNFPSSILWNLQTHRFFLLRWHHVAGIWNQTAGGGSRILKSGQLRDENACDTTVFQNGFVVRHN